MPYSIDTVDREKTGSKIVQNELFVAEMSLAIAEMYLVKKMTQKDIAAELGISQATVSIQIRKLKEEFKMKGMLRYRQYLNEEMFKLDTIEKEAWMAWERSIGRSRKTVKRKDAGGNVIEETETEDTLVGDPRYLTLVHSSIDKRIRLLGLDQPQEVTQSSIEGKLGKLILEGKVTFDMLVSEVGREQAVRYFNLAGVDVPDIITGSSTQIEDDEDDQDAGRWLEG